MKLKLDENLGKMTASLFQSGGHDIQTVQDQGLSGAADRKVIAACHSEQRCLVTLDLDFANPLVFNPAEHAGIAVLRLPAKPSHEDILDTCNTLIAGLVKEDIMGRLWIVQRGRIREYQGEDRT
jgi:predicted nuclease of predicted toxin-antitoxin system